MGRTGLLVAVGVAAAGLLMGRSLLLQPLQRQVKQLETARQLEQQKAQLLDRLGLLEQNLAAYRPKLVARKDATALVELVSGAAAAAGLSLTSVTPEPTETRGGFVRLPLRIEARGTFHHAGRFISSLERTSQFLRVDAVRIEARDDIPPSDGWAVSLTVSGFDRSS
jgi:Tfp pilus assembly protein PilO